MEFNFLSQFRNVDVGLLGFENSYAQGRHSSPKASLASACSTRSMNVPGNDASHGGHS